jgi:hypothetical protein
MPTVVPREMPRTLQANSTTVDRGRLHSSNSPGTTTRGGRVNHVAAETVQEAQDVVFGMSLIKSAPALVLFDSGASHTFISAEYVARYSIPLCTMPSSMLVNSPRGNMRAVY